MAVTAALVVAGCSTAGPGTATVEITAADRYVEGAVTVRAGSTVVWDNLSSAIHTVTVGDDLAGTRVPDAAGPIDSGDIDPFATYDHRFDDVGTYVVACRYHGADGMVGVVEVVR